MRFERTALYAHEHGFDTFTSSLGISRWKDMQQINDSGVRAASRYDDLTYWTYNWRRQGGAQRMLDISKRENFRSEEHTSELQSRGHLVCRLLLEKKKHTSHSA